MSPHARNVLIVLLSPVPAQAVGSIFNTWYNISLIKPLLAGEQESRFWVIVTSYNLIVYPLAIYFWYSCFRPIQKVLDETEGEKPVASDLVAVAQRRSVHLPWIVAGIAIVAWLFCIPVFLIAMAWTDMPLNRLVSFHLALSFFVAGLMATSQGMFAVELTTQRYLFPVLFKDISPTELRHIRTPTLKERGAIWTVAAIICPIAALTLLAMVPDAMQRNPALIAYVGIVAMIFGIVSATLIGQWISEPVTHLRKAAVAVHDGDLSTRINLVRADDFGPMISEFNRMVHGLGERQKILETFGRHVGQRAAVQILERDGQLGGTEREVSVMFADIRGFTSFSENRNAEEVVTTLNAFFSEMVDVIESHGGMVNKFLGDGLMALYGADRDTSSHASDAVESGVEMLNRLRNLNATIDHSIQIGIGIHSGSAIVGSIGSARRLEYTAIGDTVNVASRIETLTKQLEVALLISEATKQKLARTWESRLIPHANQTVKGREARVGVYSVGPYTD